MTARPSLVIVNYRIGKPDLRYYRDSDVDQTFQSHTRSVEARKAARMDDYISCSHIAARIVILSRPHSTARQILSRLFGFSSRYVRIPWIGKPEDVDHRATPMA